jgi:hypothetical protein
MRENDAKGSPPRIALAGIEEIGIFERTRT